MYKLLALLFPILAAIPASAQDNARLKNVDGYIIVLNAIDIQIPQDEQIGILNAISERFEVVGMREPPPTDGMAIPSCDFGKVNLALELDQRLFSRDVAVARMEVWTARPDCEDLHIAWEGERTANPVEYYVAVQDVVDIFIRDWLAANER